jgi:hypothetical protein
MTPVPRDKLDTTAMAEANDAEAAVAVVNGPEDGPVDWDAVQWASVEKDVRRLTGLPQFVGRFDGAR